MFKHHVKLSKRRLENSLEALVVSNELNQKNFSRKQKEKLSAENRYSIVERKCVKITTLGYKNHKSCKILPKLLPTLYFLEESYKVLQELQFLQICNNVEHFVLDSDTFLQIMHLSVKKFFTKKAMCNFD